MSGSHRLLSKRPISFYPALREISGSIAAAIMLQQVLYWWERKRGDTLYKTVSEMQAETSLTVNEQRTAIKNLKQAGFIAVEKKGLPAKRHFTVFIDKINAALDDLTSEVNSTPQSGDINVTGEVDLTDQYAADSPDRCGEINGTNTETTTESTNNTTEDKSASASSSSFSENEIDEGNKKTEEQKEPAPDDLQTKLQILAKAVGTRLGRASGLKDTATLASWLHAGADFEQDVLPAVLDLIARKTRGTVNSWAYFSGAVADARALRLAGLPPVSPAAQKRIKRAARGAGRKPASTPSQQAAMAALANRMAQKSEIDMNQPFGGANA